ncbi:MAG: hypothetical protein FD164_998 [Nitrospirae bacterium]|nr:MAG: hypothetical protein FD164_998 [Nitrospirota bacterium]
MNTRQQPGKHAEHAALPRCFLALCLLVLLVLPAGAALAAEKAEKWEGVDKAVVERIAKEQGREPSAPLINTEQGDLMLFLFLSAGAVGGFLAGYSYRALTERKPDMKEKTA